MKVKRSPWSYAAMALLLMMFMVGASSINLEQMDIFDYVNIAGILLMTVANTWIWFNPYSLILSGDTLELSENLLEKQKINLTDITSIEEPDGYKPKLIIRLTSGKVLRINSFHLTEENKKELIEKVSAYELTRA